jgi:hypothetical protein
VALRYDYAIFNGDRYLTNAMLTRKEAREHEDQGLRCIDVVRSMDPTLPRFRGRRYVRQRGTRTRRWG